VYFNHFRVKVRNYNSNNKSIRYINQIKRNTAT
jgi:hypothetical protein